MADVKLGVSATKALVTTLKLGVIAVLQKVAKDGFQVDDLLAPLGSAEFKASLGPTIEGLKNVIPELADFDVLSDGFDLGSHCLSAIKDIRTELKPAALRLQKK